MRKVTMMLVAASMFTMTMTSFAFAEDGLLSDVKDVLSDGVEIVSNVADITDTVDSVMDVGADAGKNLLNDGSEWLGNKMNGGSVEIDSLLVTSENKVNGTIKAEDQSIIGIGDVELQNAKISTVLIDSNNTLQSVEAKDKSEVLVGSVHLKNYKGNKVLVKTDNTVTGKITAKNKSKVHVGSVTAR